MGLRINFGFGPIRVSAGKRGLYGSVGAGPVRAEPLTAPGILDAPGAVVATSNKPDLWTATSAAREAKGTVYVFDPQAITHTERTW